MDVSVQSRVIELLQSIKEQYRITYFFITHDLALVKNFADDVIIMQKGKLVDEGTVEMKSDAELSDDQIVVTISGVGKPMTMHFWNEYMALEINGERAYTFPDFMMTFDARTGEPFTSAEIEEGRPCLLAAAKRGKLILGAGMRERSGYKALEAALGIEMLRYCGDLVP